jgi:hypothetical protein
MNIIFGKKRLVEVAARNLSVAKYPETAVITIEGQKEAGKSRRILINNKACDFLNLLVGEVENLVFAPVEETSQILIANAATIEGDAGEMVTYSTSKNNVTFSNSTEKGKGVSSSHMCKEFFKFLDMDDSSDLELELNSFEADGIIAFSLDSIKVLNNETPGIDELSDSIENNNQVLDTEEVVKGTQEEVTRAEADSPIFNTEVVEEEVVEAREEHVSFSRKESNSDLM